MNVTAQCCALDSEIHSDLTQQSAPLELVLQ